MPTLQKKIGSLGAKLRPFPVGKGADLSAVRQDLAAQRHVAPVTDWIWRDRRRGSFGGRAAAAPGTRWRRTGAGFVAATVCVYRLARAICVAGQFPIEMRMA